MVFWCGVEDVSVLGAVDMEDVVEQCGAVQYYLLILLVLAGGCGHGMNCMVGRTSISISISISIGTSSSK